MPTGGRPTPSRAGSTPTSPTPWCFFEIDETLLGPCALTIRFEPADPAQPSGAATELFPHIYGGLLPVDCVVSATPYVVARDSRT